jgi:hypothetical protein
MAGSGLKSAYEGKGYIVQTYCHALPWLTWSMLVRTQNSQFTNLEQVFNSSIYAPMIIRFVFLVLFTCLTEWCVLSSSIKRHDQSWHEDHVYVNLVAVLLFVQPLYLILNFISLSKLVNETKSDDTNILISN